MLIAENILSLIETEVLKVVPDARVLLFGSRATNSYTEESDWDILVLTKQPVTAALKKLIHSHIFPISVDIGAFINILSVEEKQWLSNPAYYSLRQTIKTIATL